uniref:Uncharacterized protein n=1 Tax=Arundo donax TaxID=35708 RepID=A0A0A9AA40_ARUDO
MGAAAPPTDSEPPCRERRRRCSRAPAPCRACSWLTTVASCWGRER